MVAFTINLEIETCWECSMTFAVPGDFQKARLRDHGIFFCPAGHSQSYVAESEETKLRRERDRLKQRLAEKDDDIAFFKTQRDQFQELAKSERGRANAYKGHASRITKRAKAGLCPCCNRSFVKLAEHMATKHPQFTPLEVGEGEQQGAA